MCVGGPRESVQHQNRGTGASFRGTHKPGDGDRPQSSQPSPGLYSCVCVCVCFV